MKTFAFIFARAGSKGIKNKNIKKLLKKPLIQYTLEVISQIKEINHCFVSTDSPRIGNFAKKHGAIWIKRPIKLSQDNSPEWDAWRHSIICARKMIGNFDRFDSLPVTAPLKKQQDIKNCLLKLKNDTDIVVTITPSQRSPWFNMVKDNKDGYINLLMKNLNKISRRQDTPKTYDLTTVCYVANPNFILKKKNIWQGKVKGVLIPQERSLDIDTKHDFKVAELLIGKQSKKKIKS